MGQLGGKREGAGRPKGIKNLRTIAATELVGEAQKLFPNYNPISALIALSETVGIDATLAKDCHAAVLPYMAPKFRPIEADAERLAEIEGMIAAARLNAQAQAMEDNPGLAERLERAARPIIVMTGVPRAPDDPVTDALAERLERAAPVLPASDPEQAREATPPGPKPIRDRAAARPPEYRPIMPQPEPMRFSGTMDPDYMPFSEDF